MMKRIFKKIVCSVESFWEIILYYLQLIVYEDLKNHIKESKQEKELMVLANGPSLNKSLDEIILLKDYAKKDVVTVNFMTGDDRFYVIKPRYHVASDYRLFMLSIGNEERVKLFFENINNKVDWKLTIFVAYEMWKNKTWINKISNPNVSIVPLHSITAPRSKKVALSLYKRGILGAEYGSVLHQAILTGMQLGYKKIEIFGADHTFFDGLCVDEYNRVCRRISHFYDKETCVEPISHIYTGEVIPYTMSFFMWEYERVFLGHDILRFIADNNNIIIINKTPVSMIDSYLRDKMNQANNG